MRKYSFSLERNDPVQYLLAFLCLFVYAGALFFPLMDKDAAHHANIALNMYERNNYTDLIDRGNDYLDKPHFLFWTSLVSFKIFGVNTFAHRLPALLFALLSIFSTYRLTLHLSDRTTAKLAAIMIATAQAFVLSIIDARMETPLTAFIIFSLWQLISYFDTGRWINIFFAAAGTALAFSTKGWLGPVVILLSGFVYLAMNKKWSVLWRPKTWLFLPVFIIFIAPVLYAYYQQYDLHPEKIIRGQSNRSGVKFILWNQLFERSSGFDQGKKGRNSDYFFLYHTFLWAFFPWSIIAYTALFYWLKRIFYKRKWRYRLNFAAVSFAFILFAISFSKFKMPHYIIMLLPLAAIFTAPYLRLMVSSIKTFKFFFTLQFIFALLILFATLILNYYFFQPRNILVHLVGGLMIFAFVVLLFRKGIDRPAKLVYMSVGLSLLLNFFLNYNFFPQLLQYQGGNELAKAMKETDINIPDSNIIDVEQQAHSFDFYRGHNHRQLDAAAFSTAYPALKDKYFLLSGSTKAEVEKQGFEVQPVISRPDYNVAVVKFKFLNPRTRNSSLDTIFLARVYQR
jgi:4-amino-4-deoxy-L-arabinose transferase-like glycosyltransferase